MKNILDILYVYEQQRVDEVRIEALDDATRVSYILLSCAYYAIPYF